MEVSRRTHMLGLLALLVAWAAPSRAAYACRPAPREGAPLARLRRASRQRAACAVLSVGPTDEQGRPKRAGQRPSLPTPPSRGDGYVLGEESVQPVLDALQEGGMVLLADDGDEQTQVSIVVSPQTATAEQMDFVMRHTRLPRLAMDPDRYASTYSSLHKIVLDNFDLGQPALSVSAGSGEPDPRDSSHVAETLRALASDASEQQDLRCPGAVSLVSATRGGLLKRAGFTEAAVELAQLAGLPAVALVAELRQSGWAALHRQSVQWGLPYTTTADVVALLRRKQVLVERCGPAVRMPTKFGEFTAHCFRSTVDGIEHIALVKGPAGAPDETPFSESSRPALVRVHSECCTGDIFGSLRCDCGPQLDLALEAIESDGHGVLLYLRGQEGRGIGLGAKLHAYSLQERGVDTLDANLQLGMPVDSREYGTGAQILASLGIRDLRLISNNPKKFTGLTGFGLRIVERVPSKTIPNPENLRYLRTKQERMGHMLSETMEDEAKADTSPESEPMKGRTQSEGPPVLGS